MCVETRAIFPLLNNASQAASVHPMCLKTMIRWSGKCSRRLFNRLLETLGRSFSYCQKLLPAVHPTCLKTLMRWSRERSRRLLDRVLKTSRVSFSKRQKLMPFWSGRKIPQAQSRSL
jgi:hypothetical protein